ncbi:succinate dehydrogenase, hydrophobic membrane anchor protein [Thioalkalivibrio sp. XN279]|uniref:succinate dehydrogenase, hydrophobic membrane anchor protein n=1 Tax=Thioalkalivibrio sp. XN279 TaxID=2714953 RepID=UPI0014088F5F|nr:succinate dehydrogenase, hydrophobic membrane anchor protein [Thioalkalivibrio sp. XN279]NHA15264.1 succinate dehydrogenase, hydrophobic membrane anchor protein [Thioalkalivibrio sp. XN279]
MSLRTPLGRAIGLGPAGDGTSQWWQQRVTAVALALLGLWFAFSLLGADLGDRAALVAWIARPLNAALLVLLVLTAAWHSQLGTRVIAEDYVHGALKVPLLMALQFVHAIAAAVGVVAVLQIALGGR